MVLAVGASGVMGLHRGSNVEHPEWARPLLWRKINLEIETISAKGDAPCGVA